MIDSNGSTHKYSISISVNFALLYPADCTQDALQTRFSLREFRIGSLDFSFFFKKEKRYNENTSEYLSPRNVSNEFIWPRPQKENERVRSVNFFRVTVSGAEGERSDDTVMSFVQDVEEAPGGGAGRTKGR